MDKIKSIDTILYEDVRRRARFFAELFGVGNATGGKWRETGLRVDSTALRYFVLLYYYLYTNYILAAGSGARDVMSICR